MLSRGLRSLLVVALLAAVPLLPAGTALAVAPPVAFTAVALPTHQTDGTVWALASAQGLVFAGGSFGVLRPPGAAVGTAGAARVNLAVLDAATGAPTGCAPSFTVADPAASGPATVRSLAVSPDGRTLYVGGWFDRVDGLVRNHLAALDVATCRVLGFAPTPNGTVRALAVTADTVYVGGSLNTVAGQARDRAAAVAAVGTATPGALLPWSPRFDRDVRALALSPQDGAVVVGGDFDAVNGSAAHALAVVDPGTGATVHTWPFDLYPRASVVKGLSADASGFYVANEGTGSGVFDGRTAFGWDYVERWRDTCLGATQAVVAHESVVYSAHHAHDCTTTGGFSDGPRKHFFAQRTDDGALLPWFPDSNDGLGEGIGPRALTVASTPGEDVLWSGGEFTRVNGQPQQGLTRFGQTDHSAGPTSPSISVMSTRAGQVRVAWRQSTDTDDGVLTYRVYRNAETTPVHTVTGTAPFWSRRQLVFTDTRPVGSTHRYRVTVTDGTTVRSSAQRSVIVASTGSAYAQRVADDGALLHWRYDEPSDVFLSDATVHESNGTLRGGATYSVSPGALAGDPSRALSLPGLTGTIFSEQRFPQPGAYSLETWFSTTTTRGGKIMGFGDRQLATARVSDKMLYMTDDGRLVFGAGTGSAVVSPSSYNDGAWHHVVATQGQNGMVLHVDGQRVGTHAQTTNRAGNGFLRVGGDVIGGSSWPSRPTSNHFGGTLDETAYYPTALPTRTVVDHYRIGRGEAPAPPTDAYASTVRGDDPVLYWRLGEDSGSTAQDAGGSNGTPGGYVGEVALGAPGAVRGTTDTAVALRPVGLVAAAQSRAGTPAYSAEAWVRTTGTTGGQLLGFGSAPTGSSSVNDRVVFLRDDGRISAGVRSGGTTTTVTSPQGYRDGAWHHVAVTKGSSGLSLYVDGQVVASSATTAARANASTTSGWWRAGHDALAGWPGAPSSSALTASVDEVAVYSGPLTAEQVATHARTGSAAGPDTTAPGPTGPLSAQVDGTTVSLAWPAGTDDTGVTGYDVHRSSTDGFLPSADTRLATAPAPEHVDAGLPAGTYYYRVLARDAAGNTGEPSPQARAVVPDVRPPTSPEGGTASVVGTSVTLRWTASTDDTVVRDYEVHRGSEPDVVPGGSTLVGTTTTTALTEQQVPTGTWYYRVVARDAAGNRSEPAPAVQAVVAAQPVVVSLQPSADAYTNEGAPTTNYGSTSSLFSRGSSGYRSFLRFELPAAPAGTRLTAAVLRVRTTDQTFAGSTEPHHVLVAGDGWTEAGVTWRTQPALVPGVVGTVAAGAAPGSVLTVPLSAAALADRAGSTSLAVTGDGTDNLTFWSRNHADPAARPVLHLTYE